MQPKELHMSEWKRCTAERYDEMLGVLPPALMLGYGFLVGEPFDHRTCKVTGDTRASFAAFVVRRGEYYEGPHMTMPEFRALDLNTII